MTVGGANTVPDAPTNLRSCIGGQVDCPARRHAAPSGVVVVGWDAPADPDGKVAFYRIYRDGIAYGTATEYSTRRRPRSRGSSTRPTARRTPTTSRRSTTSSANRPSAGISAGRAADGALREEEGMTLVEVLMASVLMLIVLGATLTTFNNFERNVKTNDQQNEAQEQARRAMDLMARDLRNIASPTPNLPLAVDRTRHLDVIFQSQGKEKPPAASTRRTPRVCATASTPSRTGSTGRLRRGRARRRRGALGHRCPGAGLDQDNPGGR